MTKLFIAHIREKDNKIQTVEEHSKQTAVICQKNSNIPANDFNSDAGI